jgi:flagellar basal-body rod protein FlgB
LAFNLQDFNKSIRRLKLPQISLFGKEINMLEYSMDIRSRIHSVISSNIANVNTPNYKCKSVDFEKEFSKILKKDDYKSKLVTTNSKHIQVKSDEIEESAPETSECKNRIFGNDKNNVDIDKEMAKLSKNQLLYTIDSQILVKDLKILKNAIIEGGR